MSVEEETMSMYTFSLLGILLEGRLVAWVLFPRTVKRRRRKEEEEEKEEKYSMHVPQCKTCSEGKMGKVYLYQ